MILLESHLWASVMQGNVEVVINASAVLKKTLASVWCSANRRLHTHSINNNPRFVAIICSFANCIYSLDVFQS